MKKWHCPFAGCLNQVQVLQTCLECYYYHNGDSKCNAYDRKILIKLGKQQHCEKKTKPTRQQLENEECLEPDDPDSVKQDTKFAKTDIVNIAKRKRLAKPQ